MIPFVHNAGGDKASTPAAQSTGKGTEHELLALDPSARALHWRLPWVRPHVRSIFLLLQVSVKQSIVPIFTV